MKYGFVGQFKEAADVAVEIGAQGLPLWLNPAVAKDPEAATAAAGAKGMGICQIGAFGYNPLDADTEAQAKQAATLEATIPVVDRIGCPYFVINSGNVGDSFMLGHADNFTDAALDRVAKALEKPLALAEEHGAKIVVEPMIHCVVNSPERYFALKERVQSNALGINLDILNMFTLADMYAPTEGMKRICGALAGEYDLVHCKDLAVTNGVHIHIDETPLGTGVADWAAALPMVAESLPAEGWFMYEHVKSADDARAGNALLRNLCGEAGIALGA